MHVNGKADAAIAHERNAKFFLPHGGGRGLEHRAKKWVPVFRNRRCDIKASREKVGTGFSQ
jgi:hypothetical protein